MIHHASLPAEDPARVARALAELLQATLYPFPGARGHLVVADDAHGTAIEVVAADFAFAPGEGDRQVRFDTTDARHHSPFHLLLSVPVSRDTVLALAEREGWRALPCWRGSRDHPRDFELIELWIENRTMLEILTPEMVPGYVAHMRTATLSPRHA